MVLALPLAVKNSSSHQQNLETRVLDNLSAAVLLFDQELHLRYINPAGEMLLAVSSRPRLRADR